MTNTVNTQPKMTFEKLEVIALAIPAVTDGEHRCGRRDDQFAHLIEDAALSYPRRTNVERMS
jgi:hypothetical protein